MIEIHLGVLGADESAGRVIVREPQDYISVRLAVREALRTGNDLQVYVQTRVCDDWFWDLENSPGVKLSREDPPLRLCQKLGVASLPPEVADPALIMALKLLDLPDPIDTVQDVAGWVAAHKLGAVWTMQNSSYAHLTDLLMWWTDYRVPEVLQPLADRRMNSWIDNATGQLREAYQAIKQDPITSALFLCCWQVLQGYDDVTREDWLREAGWYCPGIGWLAEKVGELTLPRQANRELSLKAEAYWRRRLLELDQEISR